MHSGENQMGRYVTHRGALDMQVCVPWDLSDEEVLDFANRENPCGTENGWSIRKEGDRALNGSPERVQCFDSKDNCHIMLDA
jgi:hypothetical protein